MNVNPLKSAFKNRGAKYRPNIKIKQKIAALSSESNILINNYNFKPTKEVLGSSTREATY